MLADTVEAACRTLEKPSVSRLDKFIQVLIAGKLEHHQLDNCNLTFKELTAIREVFVKILAGYYHSRIEYPEQKDPDSDKKEIQNDEKKSPAKTKTVVKEKKAADLPAKIKAKKEEKNGK